YPRRAGARRTVAGGVDSRARPRPALRYRGPHHRRPGRPPDRRDRGGREERFALRAPGRPAPGDRGGDSLDGVPSSPRRDAAAALRAARPRQQRSHPKIQGRLTCRPMHDYIVVGAGSAGCVLAARLSEDPLARVLLLEAGGADSALFIRGPGLYYMLWRGKHDRGLPTPPPAGGDGREKVLPPGQGVGGARSPDTTGYIRRRPPDYHGWGAPRDRRRG